MMIAKMLLFVCAASSRTSIKVGRIDSIDDKEGFRFAMNSAGNLQSSTNSSEPSLHHSLIEANKPTPGDDTLMSLAPAFLLNALRAVLGGYHPKPGEIPPDLVQAKIFVHQLAEYASSEFKHVLHDDPFSCAFFNSFTWRMLNQMCATSASENFMYATSVFSAVRTQLVDNKIQSAIRSGVKQIVYWGMALDTRALRLHNPNVTVYEVDDASALDIKLEAMKDRLNIHDYPARLVRLASWNTPLVSLLSEGLESVKPVLFVWEARSMYQPVLQSTEFLKLILVHFPVAYVVFDSLDPEVATSDFSIIQEALRSPDLYPGKLALSHIRQIATDTGAELDTTTSIPNYAGANEFESSIPEDDEDDVLTTFRTGFQHMRLNVIKKTSCKSLE